MKRSEQHGQKPLRVVMPQNGGLVFNYGSVMFGAAGLNYLEKSGWTRKTVNVYTQEAEESTFMRKTARLLVFFIIVYLPLL
ncbi:MAG: hypothetical protein KKA81_14595 [Bacteroidetes bacterium]|nr:hypothetical protein [Bacteroidota bacterium]